jgi:hypothetical protein
MKPTRYIPVLCAALFPFVVAACANGCKKESDELPPAPSAVATPTAAASPTAVAPIVPEEPDAGADAADAEADVKKATGGGDPTGIRKCCSALAQNANSAPPEQKAYYMSAAAACNGMVNSPQGRQALASLRGLLMGASMPAACQ